MADLGTEIRNAIRAKKLDMQQAADKLEMSRSALYNKLNSRELQDDKEFLGLLQERLHINWENTDRNGAEMETERTIGNTEMKFLTVPLKDGRIIQMWMPKNFSKSDSATLKQWIAFFESTL